MKKTLLLILIAVISISCKSKTETQLVITPIEHGTAAFTFGNLTVFVDPTGNANSFTNFSAPNYIFITDIHGDHLSLKTLESLDLSKTTIVAPKAVADKIPKEIAKEIIIINNGENKTFGVFNVETIPMYNLREEALKFHTKGRGNGYVFNIAKQRIYFSGDTEDIPEMRALKNIDKAFVCMNLPYTMTIESAADAVLEFKPKEVYPYHYRGTEGLSDVAKFKSLVNKGNTDIKVIQLNWYPNQE
ncbi:MAG: L-ascorbate metabolism protein UlaG (beta-lactamase superfamily) [Polaribacter sp.]|jgi:L-ascorbate metabolism protein UlaG (beta-lactamase superfamily)